MTHRLTFPAPIRAQIRHEGGTFSSRQWEVADVELALASGAWFRSGDHEFANNEARRIAFDLDNKGTQS